MNRANMDLPKSKVNESWVIYQRLCYSKSMSHKCIKLKAANIMEVLNNTLAVLNNNDFNIATGSEGEGTDITLEDYGKHLHSITPIYVSDVDMMNVLYHVQVIDERDTLPHRFDKHIYCRAERGEHTTDGFRKIRIIHSPEYHSRRQSRVERWAHLINMSLEHAYISSSKLLAKTLNSTSYSTTEQEQTDLGTQGPSRITMVDGSPSDYVICFYVKAWPKEAEPWFTRRTHWPDRKLKMKLRKTGYLLVATGNRKSKESDLEWRCSFSIAEKILFQSMTKCQRYTFIMMKVVLKEYLSSDINTDGEKQLLSTYHIKTLFFWCFEDGKIKWVPEDMVGNIGIMFDKLLSWIYRQYFPHYFIPSVNLLDGTKLHGRENSLIRFISSIRNDLSKKIKQSQFLMGQETNQKARAFNDMVDGRFLFMFCHHHVMPYFRGRLQTAMHDEVIFNTNILRGINFSHVMLIEGLMRIKLDVDPQLHNLYRAMYTDPVHDKLLTDVVPGLIDQYRGCIYLAKYCMAKRDGIVMQDNLNTAESLLNDTLHLDPCSGHVKLACLYIITRNFPKAMQILDTAENNFLLIHHNMVTSGLRNLQVNGVKVDRFSTEAYTFTMIEAFHKWTEGQLISDIVVKWPEYITVPDLVQFELIHESTSKVLYVPYKYGDDPGKMMVGAECRLQCPPLSLIKMLKFLCTLNLGRSSASDIDNLVAELIASSL